MGSLKVHQEKVTSEIAEKMCALCPFHAISYEDGTLKIDASCRMCRLCVKNGVPGVVTFEEEAAQEIDKNLWNGIAVFAEWEKGEVHPVVYELLGKAKELAEVNGHPVYVLLVGYELSRIAEELLHYGADCVYCYDSQYLSEFKPGPYTNVIEDFVNKIHPSVMMYGATVKGRSLAPRAAARFQTGLTADCTVLKMKKNTDLVQIRPAFGGNIMAQIVTPNCRPQFCTVRYKVFSSAERSRQASGKIEKMGLADEKLKSCVKVQREIEKPKTIDIAQAEVIVAVGRGVKSRQDLAMAQELAELLGAQLACTRPLIEAGWFDARRQIGLSGRTVKPKLIITLGISGSVQFAAGMKGAECIISINQDKNADIFNLAHYCFVGDLYEILPKLLCRLKGGAR